MDIDVFIWNSQENRTPMSKTLSGKRVISEASPFDQWWEIQFIGSVAPQLMRFTMRKPLSRIFWRNSPISCTNSEIPLLRKPGIRDCGRRFKAICLNSLKSIPCTM